MDLELDLEVELEVVLEVLRVQDTQLVVSKS